MKRNEWIWMPHAAHFICGNACQFKLATYVGKYIVSTVGDYPDSITGKFTNIGANRMFETMVFKAKKSDNKCCPYEIIVEKHVDMEGYNKQEDAMEGHYKLCEKWSKRR